MIRLTAEASALLLTLACLLVWAAVLHDLYAGVVQ